MKSTFSRMAVVALTMWLGLAAGAANADLTATGAGAGKTVYDAEANLSWLANANLAASNTFGVSDIYPDGGMSWSTAKNWIVAMDAANYLGYHDWRLPTRSDACVPCTTNEMGQLFYNELGGVGGESITTIHNGNYYVFQNVQSGSYWTGISYPSYTPKAYVFSMGNGIEVPISQSYNAFAWAVRTGQVSAVPEPETYAMLLAGLGLLGFTAWRRKNLSA